MLRDGRDERINKRNETGERWCRATSLFLPSPVFMQMTSQSAHVRVRVIDSFTLAARSKAKDFIINRTWIILLQQAVRCWSLHCLFVNTHTRTHTKGAKEKYLFANHRMHYSDLKAPKPSVASASELHVPLCHSCQKIHPRCEIDLKTPVVTATPMTRLDVSGLPGWQPSFSQSRQTGHALFNHYPSICPLSLILVWKLANSSTKHMRQWVPSRSIWAPIRQFHQLNQILKCLHAL